MENNTQNTSTNAYGSNPYNNTTNNVNNNPYGSDPYGSATNTSTFSNSNPYSNTDSSNSVTNPHSSLNNSSPATNSNPYSNMNNLDYSFTQPTMSSNIYIEESNPILGLIGALIGAIPGCILWIILGQINFIAGIAGFVIIMGSIKGYELMGKSITKGGIIACIVITCIMIFASNFTDYAISLYSLSRELGMEVSFGEILSITPEFISDSEVIGNFILNLVIGYALTAASSYKAITALIITK